MRHLPRLDGSIEIEPPKDIGYAWEIGAVWFDGDIVIGIDGGAVTFLRSGIVEIPPQHLDDAIRNGWRLAPEAQGKVIHEGWSAVLRP